MNTRRDISEQKKNSSTKVKKNKTTGRTAARRCPRKEIPIDILERLTFTGKYTREETLRLITCWNSGLSSAKIEKKMRMTPWALRMRIHKIRSQGGIARKRTFEELCMNTIRPIDTTYRGLRKCIQCGKQFQSWHTRKNQICDRCKNRIEARSNDHFEHGYQSL